MQGGDFRYSGVLQTSEKHYIRDFLFVNTYEKKFLKIFPPE